MIKIKFTENRLHLPESAQSAFSYFVQRLCCVDSTVRFGSALLLLLYSRPIIHAVRKSIVYFTSFSDIAEFLEKTERELQSRFNTCCCFMSLNKITAEFAESAAVTITQWHGQANVLCYKSSLVPVATCEYSTNVVVVSQIDKLIY